MGLFSLKLPTATVRRFVLIPIPPLYSKSSKTIILFTALTQGITILQYINHILPFPYGKPLSGKNRILWVPWP